MSVWKVLAMGGIVWAMSGAGVAWAEPPTDGTEAPVGLEKLRKKSNPSGPLSGDTASEVKPDPGAKSLGHGPEEGASEYTPGAPSGDRGARPETIGGGTRVKSGASSALDDIR